MTDVRSYTNGHGRRSGTASHPRKGGDFVNALQDAVRENPISAAFIGMGVLWMFMGGSGTSLFGGDGRKSIFRTAAQGAEQVGGAVRNTAERIGSSVGYATKAGSEAASQAVGGVREASAAVGETASRTAGQAVDAVASAYDATVSTASRAAESISNASTSAAGSVQEIGTKRGSTLQQNITDIFERQPLLLAAVGFAIGAGFAASIPTAEAEKKVMGQGSDFLREKVTDKVVEVKEMADAALHEAKVQGLTPDAAGKALRTIGEKVASVAGAKTATSSLGPTPGSKKV